MPRRQGAAQLCSRSAGVPGPHMQRGWVSPAPMPAACPRVPLTSLVRCVAPTASDVLRPAGRASVQVASVQVVSKPPIPAWTTRCKRML